MKRIKPNNYHIGLWRWHILSVLVWFGAAAGVVGLFFYRSQRFEVLGFAAGEVRQIAATCTGRLKSVPVQLFETVSQGQTVAVLDDEHLQAQLATVSAEIKRLMAELIPTQEQLLAEAASSQSNWIADKRRFAIDVENARLRILELKTLIETDRLMLENLNLEVKTAEDLLEQQAVAPYELHKAQIEYNTLAKKIEENQNLLAQSEQDLKQTQRRYDDFAQHLLRHRPVDSSLEPIREAIKVQEQLIEELLVERAALVLKSPFDGVVSQIQARLGEAVLPGVPILTVAQAHPAEIIAYGSENQVSQIEEGTIVELVKNSQPAQIAQSQVSYVGPVVEQMPLRLWQNPNIPQWGRPFLVKVPPQMKLIPGELVGIRRQ